MSDECLFEKLPSGVGLITLNRPESLNAMGGRLVPLLAEYLERCETDKTIRCVAITGAGRGFCAGGDVKGFARNADATDARAADSAIGATSSAQAPHAALEASHMRTSFKLHTMAKPTVALVNGPAAGAGMSLALSADIRFCSDRARFVTAFGKIGLSGDFGGSYFLQRLMGYGRALEAYYLAESIDAPKALALGIANHVVPHDELMTQGLAFCERLAKGPTRTFANMKRAFNAAETSALKEFLSLEAKTMTDSMTTADFREGARAWVQNRPPEYKGE